MPLYFALLHDSHPEVRVKTRNIPINSEDHKIVNYRKRETLDTIN